MRLLISFVVFAASLPAQQFGYAVLNHDPGPWNEVLASIGMLAKPVPEASVLVARPSTPAAPEWAARVESGAFLILEGDSSLGRSFGFRLLDRTTRLSSLIDTHQPQTPLILEKSLELTETAVPAEARVFTRERWTNVPVLAGFRRGKGAVLWVATSPGKHGYERFSFLANALCDLGFEPPFRSNRLWAFFDYAYRARVDVNWFAKRWHASGIAALQVAAWHFYDRDPDRDRYLAALIEACHREGVLVYAWLELPHVSERFWADHPEWREKTALLQDAQLDWRKLMNLAQPECASAVRSGIRDLTAKFDWDGVNFAELYYESLEGAANPARFTPLNEKVRQDFRASPGGFDPVELWSTRKDAASLRMFLDFRAGLARGLQKEWLDEAENYRSFKPDLDIVLTHVDDRLDTGMRDAIGADTSRLIPLMDRHRFTFLIEDPATVWDQGPQRYPLIASKYAEASQLAVDINIVERYQDVYPTRQQTGLELYGLVHLASASFSRVALYIENSLPASDLALLSAAASEFQKAEWVGSRLVVTSKPGGGVRWKGAATVDGHAWPVQNQGTIWLPPGPHTVERTSDAHDFRVLSLTGTLTGADYRNQAVQFSYDTEGRTIARFNKPLAGITVDGAAFPFTRAALSVLLPRGKHSVLAWPQADESGSGSGRHSGQVVLPDWRSQQNAGN